MAKVIAIANHKGGVGKTTTTANLGIGLVRAGRKVLLIDADPQGSLTAYMGCVRKDEAEVTLSTLMARAINNEEINAAEGIIHHPEGVDYIPANITLSALNELLVTVVGREYILQDVIETLRDAYDYILIDCSTSITQISTNTLVAADSVIITLKVDYLTVDAMNILLDSMAKVRKRLNRGLKVDGILLTMAKPNANLTKQIAETVRTVYDKLGVFDTVIPESVKAQEASMSNRSVMDYAKNSSVAKAYAAFTEEVLELEEN